MKQYAAFYNGTRSPNLYHDDNGVWQIIYKKHDEDAWYVEVPDAGSKESAERLASALNTQEFS